MKEKQPTYGNGKICYLEIPATDFEISSSFYSRSFGWKRASLLQACLQDLPEN